MHEDTSTDIFIENCVEKMSEAVCSIRWSRRAAQLFDSKTNLFVKLVFYFIILNAIGSDRYTSVSCLEKGEFEIFFILKPCYNML